MKKVNRILFSGLGLSMLLLLSGCVQVKDGKPAGFVWDIIGRPMSLAIQYFHCYPDCAADHFATGTLSIMESNLSI